MNRGIAMVVLAAASWGTYSLFLRPSGLPPSATAPMLFAVMALATLPFALREPRATWDRATVGLLIGNVVFDAVNVITYFAALAKTTVAIAVLTHYLAPILIAVAAPYVEGTRTPGARPAAAVALVGLAIILEPWRAPAEGAVVGASLGALSAVCYAGNTFVLRRLGGRIGATRAMAYHSAIAAVLLVPLLLLPHPPITARGVLIVVAAAITLGAVAGIVFIRGLGQIGSARAAVLTFAEPLVAVLVGALCFHEAVSPLALLGGALVLGAGITVSRGAGSSPAPSR